MRPSLLLCLTLTLALGACKSNDDDTKSAGTGGAGGAPVTAGGAGTGGAGGAVDVAVRDYPATDERIRYTGRVDFSEPTAPRFSAPGVYIEARFRGNAVTVLLEDQLRYGNRNYYDVIIDDGTPTKLEPESDVTEYVVATDLPYGEHTVRLAKRTEASVGHGDFLGFRFGGQLLEPAPARARRIELIGDSITAGAGIEARNNSPECSEDGWGQPYHNAGLTYGAVAARALDADYHITAVSGIGLIQNYSTLYDARTMPEVYDLMFVEQTTSPTWDTSRYVPDAIVVALGTNDFSVGDPNDPANQPPSGEGGAGGGGAGGAGGVGTGGTPATGTWHRPVPTPEEYAAAYVTFVERLRGYYPDAHIFCMSSPMLGDTWPNPTDTFATDLRTAVGLVEDHFVAAGDEHVHALVINRTFGLGCGTHPDAEAHEEIAAEVETALGEVLGW